MNAPPSMPAIILIEEQQNLFLRKYYQRRFLAHSRSIKHKIFATLWNRLKNSLVVRRDIFTH